MRNNLIFNFFTFWLLLSSTLYASMLTEYRINGIKKIQKQMDSDLAHREYWDDFLEDVDTQFGYIESYENILTCDKSHSTLSLYTKDTEHYKLKKTYSAYTGKMQGDKAREGDLKTPVGIYNLTKKLSKVDSFYGPMAFVTSYPNTYDLYIGKGGSGIWIHGLPTQEERDSFTKGCIAIKNKSIECLDRNIDINKTLLIIDEHALEKQTPKETYADLLAQLYSWRYAWIYNDITAYLNFYDSTFKRYDGLSLSRFSNYKKRIFKKMEEKSIIFNNINVIPYPGTKNIFKITFFEKYHSNNFSFNGEKILIVKLIDGKMKIITEQ